MYVKKLDDHEVLDGFHMVWSTFEDEAKEFYTEEGMQSFRDFLLFDKAINQIRAREITVFGAIEDNQICGVSVINKYGQIPFIVVKKEYRKRGVGRQLELAMYQYCQQMPNISKMRVYCIPQFSEFFRHIGYTATQAEMEKNGMKYLEFEKHVQSVVKPVVKEKNVNRGIFIAVGISVVVLLVVLGFLTGKMARMLGKEEITEIPHIPGGKPPIVMEEQQESEGEQEDKGIESISAYTEEDLPYTLTEETYTYSSGADKGEYPIEFDVKYPQIQSTELLNVAQINDVLKETAMMTVNTLYLEPGQDIKESMIKEKEPFIGSQVTYKVTYAGKDFISVAYSDNYYVGNLKKGFMDLRTRNIRLSDGKVFNTSDAVDLSTDFMHMWIDKMKKEAPDSLVMEKLYMSDFRKILNGQVLNDSYYDNMFFDADGVQIGMTFHYDDEEGNVTRGWITAPFTMKEIMPYKTDSEVWNLVESIN